MSLLLATAATFAERIRINRVSRELRDGRMVWIKQRRWLARPIMAGANRFFQLAGNPVQAISDPTAWQQWEVLCFQGLHGDSFVAFDCGADAVAAEEMPGESLSRYLDAGTFTPALAAVAARELRRTHAWECAAFDGGWSHGDPHTGNFLFDTTQERARLIDFEMRHVASLPADDRHADDLLVFLQDVVGRIDADAWLPVAQAFLEAYDRPEIIARLRPRLQLPQTPVPRLWWAVRTSYLPSAELTRRLGVLRRSLDLVSV